MDGQKTLERFRAEQLTDAMHLQEIGKKDSQSAIFS